MFGSIIKTNRKSEADYEPLSPSSDDFSLRKTKNGQNFLTTWCLVALVCGSILQISLVCYGISLMQTSRTPSQVGSDGTVSNCSCGTTIQEAKSMGCEFDVLSLSWLPKACRDVALTQEFASSGPGPQGKWDYWADVNGTEALTLDQVSALADEPEGVVYTSLGFHVLHCSFYWRKQWRVMNGVGALAMEARYAPESHVKHCSHIFMMEGSRETGKTQGLVRIGGAFF